jgi:hypothetical protein
MIQSFVSLNTALFRSHGYGRSRGLTSWRSIGSPPAAAAYSPAEFGGNRFIIRIADLISRETRMSNKVPAVD